MGVSDNSIKGKGVAAKTVGKLVLAFFVCLVSFSTLKLVASVIPQELLLNTLLESSATLDQEGDYHSLVGEETSVRLDNFTTAIMLKVCASNHAAGLEAAFGDYHYQNRSVANDRQIVSLREQLSDNVSDDDSGWTPYARYWNGYTIILKPMLLFLNLNDIRMLFVVLGGLLLLVDVCLLARIRGLLAGVAFGLPFFAVNYLVALISLSFAFAFLVALVGVLFVLLKTQHEKDTFSAAAWAVPFFALGASTAFLDFLCTPIVTLGLPLAALVYVKQNSLSSYRQLLAIFVIAIVCWGLGYGLLWVSKWILSSLVLGWDVVNNAMQQVVLRVSDSTGAPNAPPMDSLFSAIARNATLLFSGWAIKALVVFAVVFLVMALACLNHIRLIGVKAIIALIAIAALPYLWYLFASNHSYVHYYFTYRAQVVSLVCCLFILETVFHPFLKRKAVLNDREFELPDAQHSRFINARSCEFAFDFCLLKDGALDRFLATVAHIVSGFPLRVCPKSGCT